jgi:hypothetical protein
MIDHLRRYVELLFNQPRLPHQAGKSVQ